MIPEFNFERPNTLEEAIALIAARQDTSDKNNNFVLSSGGTDLIPRLKLLESTPDTVISLTSIRELAFITLIASPNKMLRVGSQTTLSDLASHKDIATHLLTLSKCASLIASPQIRNRATVGGNLLADNRCIYFNQSSQNRAAHGPCFKAGGESCHLIPNASRDKSPLCRARFISDLAPVLILLGAMANLASPRGERTLPVSDFYLPDGIDRLRLKQDEILTHVDIPLPGPEFISYEKLRIRNAIDFPSLGVAVSVSKATRTFSIAITGVNTRPMHFFYNMSGEQPGALPSTIINKACNQAQATATALKHDFFPPQYRKKMIKVFIERAFQNMPGELWT